jgi:hypothetical protein
MNFNLRFVDFKVASMPAAPTLIAWDSTHNICVQICASPVLGMDPIEPNSLCYPVTVMAEEEYELDQIEAAIASAVDSFRFETLDVIVGDECRILISKDFKYVEDDLIEYLGVVSMSSTPEHIGRVKKLLEMQLNAFKTVKATNKQAEGTLQ